jgi:hypothetical protein
LSFVRRLLLAYTDFFSVDTATPAEEVVEEIVKERGEEVANEVANEAQPVSDTEKNDNIVERHHEDDVEADNEDAAAVKPVSPRTPRPYSNSRRRNSSFSDPHSPIDSVKEHVAARVQEEREERVVPLPVDRQELQVLPEKGKSKFFPSALPRVPRRAFISNVHPRSVE